MLQVRPAQSLAQIRGAPRLTSVALFLFFLLSFLLSLTFLVPPPRIPAPCCTPARRFAPRPAWRKQRRGGSWTPGLISSVRWSRPGGSGLKVPPFPSKDSPNQQVPAGFLWFRLAVGCASASRAPGEQMMRSHFSAATGST